MALSPTAFQIMMKCQNDTTLGTDEVFDNENEVNYVNVAENENDKSECWNAAGSGLEIKQHAGVAGKPFLVMSCCPSWKSNIQPGDNA